MNTDQLRVTINPILAATQILSIIWAIFMGPGSDLNNSTEADAPIIPALYVFSIWSIPYLGSVIYSVIQAVQREKPIFKRIGWWTALAFFGNTMWSVFLGLGLPWLTIPCMFIMFGALLRVCLEFVNHSGTRLERFLVIFPLGVYCGYTSVATIANTAGVMFDAGIRNLLLNDITWATVMLVIAAAITAFVAFTLRGNVGYAFGVIWAAVGIIVENNLPRQDNPSIVMAAIVVIVAVLVAAMIGRWGRQPPLRLAAQ